MHRSVALVDLSYLFRRNWHAQQDREERNTAGQRTLDTLSKISHEAAHVIVCLDSPPYFRSEIDADYKRNRPAASEEIKAAKRWLYDQLRASHYQAAKAQGYEADDIIASLAPRLIVTGAAAEVWIYGSDKDLFQCLGEHVSMLSPTPDGVELRGPETVRERLGVTVEQVPDYLALTGDTADNIPGCPGVGPKKAALILQHYETIGKALEAAQAEPDAFAETIGSRVIGPRMVEMASRLMQSWNLTLLRTDAPLDVESLLKPRKVERQEEPKPPPRDADEEEDEMEEVDGEPVQTTVAPRAATPQAAQPKASERPLPAMAAQPQESTALAPHTGEWEMRLEPDSHKLLYWMSQQIHESGLYSKLRPEGIYACALKGRSLGMGVMTALDNINIVEGRPALGWQAIVAFASQHPDCEYIMCAERTPRKATWETKRKGHPRATTLSYTLEEAQQAGLIRPKSGWEKHPADMLSKTAAVKLARLVYPDSRAQGLYCAEELGE